MPSNKMLKEENEKLTEENKNYKDENKLLQEMLVEIGLIDEFKEMLMNPIKQDGLYINKLIAENKKLKEQIDGIRGVLQ
tara:strand:+ start:383 stop:619 length:237 start_codon:yes stop_codon:yes gene_type:complete